MNNFIMGVKKFFTNKNVVTVIGVLVILMLLFWGYTTSIKKETNPVKVPVAAKTINSKTQITQEDVTYREVPGSMVGAGVVKSSFEVIGKYTNINVTIPVGSVFYYDWLVTEDKLPGNWIDQLNYEAGEVGYYMNVNMVNTLGNNVLPNTYIDIYMKTTDENGTIMFGKLLKNVKVLVVHDGSGNDVFQNASSVSSPSKIGFAVSQDLYILLNKVEYLGDVELIITPRGSNIPNQDYIVVTSATLRDMIDAKTITVEEDVVVEEVQDSTTEVNPEENNVVE